MSDIAGFKLKFAQRDHQPACAPRETLLMPGGLVRQSVPAQTSCIIGEVSASPASLSAVAILFHAVHVYGVCDLLCVCNCLSEVVVTTCMWWYGVYN
jgi:hypothetical protein